MTNADNSTQFAPTFATFDIGNGLIEIAALTSLIGSATAQTLALGNKGPAGLVWATMTIFGGMSIVRAGIAAVTPGWLRDSLGVRSTETDAAVGLSLNLNKKRTLYRAGGGVAKGVECEVKIPGEPVEIARRDIHVFDQRTTCILNATPPAGPGEPLKIYAYRQDPYYTETTLYQAWLDWICLLLSFLKLVEVCVLWMYGAVMLVWVALLTWLYFFLAGVFLQLHGRLSQRLQSKYGPVIDIVASSNIPIPSSAGGTRRVVLGIPCDARRHVTWKIVWALNSLVCTVSIITTYMALGQAPSFQVFIVWTSFQIVWMALRSTFFHVVKDRERPYLASLKGKPWAEVGSQEKTRVHNLVLGLAEYQYHVHPRGPWSYNEDIKTMKRLENHYTEYPSAISDGADVQILVHGVIGDALLSSVSWISGSKKGGFDFYDTCIVILNLKGEEVAIPAARVLSAVRPGISTDPEQADQYERPPEGSSNIAVGIEWWFWVPCSNGRWLYFGSQDLKFKGQRSACVLTDDQVTERLEKGELFVSLKHVDEVKEIVKTSTEGCGYLLELLA